MMAFHVGQKVVCVNANPWPGMVQFGDDEAPILGGRYTIRRVFVWRDGTLVFWLNELARNADSRAEHGDDVGYGAWRFRPVRTTDKGMEILNSLLLPKPKKVKQRDRERA